MNADKESLLQDLLDREAIRDLPILYCHYVRERDYVAILDLFTDDAEFDVDPKLWSSGVATGRSALEKVYRDSLTALDPWPFVHNHVVKLHSRTAATGTVYAEFRMGRDNLRTTSIGTYADTYVKTDSGTWRFKSRQLTSTSIPSSGED